ncbi:MAG: DUF2141 domain-containing protein [Sphingobium sp.]
MAILTVFPAGATPSLPDDHAAGGSVEVHVEGLRSTKGMIRVCLTRDRSYYPHCDRDPEALHVSADAGAGAAIRVAAVPAGDYALLVLHDENANRRVDTMLGIPREGVGFSRNPRLFMGPPSFDSVRFAISGKQVEQTVQMRYFL